MRRLSSHLLLILTALALAACAAEPRQALTFEQKLLAKGYAQGERVRRIQDYRLNGWSYLDRRHVIMDSGVSDHYLVALRTDCTELQSAINLGFSTTVGGLTDSDKLLVRAPGDFTQTCMIDSLYELIKIKRPADSG